MGAGGGAGHRDPVHARPRDHAGLHRRPVHRRPGHHARGHRRPRRRRGAGQPAGSGRAGHRPLGDHRRLRPAGRLRAQRRVRVRPQPRALPVPALGAGRLRRLQGRAAGHRHRPPGQHRVPRARRHDPRGRRRPAGLSGHPGGHRLPHHDGQRARRPGLGRRRHRGRGGHAGAAGVDAHPAGRRLQAQRRNPRWRNGNRRRPDDHPDAAQARRRRQVRRVLRRGRRRGAAGEPRDDRQHEPGVRIDLRDLPDRPGDAGLPHADRPAGRAGRARRGLRQGAGALARPEPGGDLLPDPRARPVDRRAEHRRAEAAAGPDRADRRQGVLPRGAARLRRAPRR